MAEFINEKFLINIFTPLVLYGNNQLEAQANSIRGELRWWLRALIGEVKKARDAENVIFGSTDRSSKLKLRVVTPKTDRPIQVNDLKFKKWRHDLFYFNYYIANKSAFRNNSNIKITMSLDDFNTKETQYRSYFYKTLQLFSIFGALGARSRKGYGSFSMSHIEKENGKKNIINHIQNPENLKEEINKIFIELDRTNTNIKGFYNLFNAKVFIGYKHDNVGYDSYEDALKDIINKMREDVRNDKKNSGYFEIKELIQEFIENNAITSIPNQLTIESAAFGFPLNYQSRTIRNKTGYQNSVIINLKGHERVASPVFIKIYKIGQKYYQLVTYFENNILKTGQKIELKFNKYRMDHNRKKKDVADFLCETKLKITTTNEGVPIFVNRFLNKLEPIIE